MVLVKAFIKGFFDGRNRTHDCGWNAKHFTNRASQLETIG